MRYLRRFEQNEVELGERLGAGGEGAVHEVRGRPREVVKIYHTPTDDITRAVLEERSRKLPAMVNLFRREKILADEVVHGKNHQLLTWPIDVIDSPAGEFLGFIMLRAEGTAGIQRLYMHELRSREAGLAQVDPYFLHQLAMNLCKAVLAVHRSGCVIGDLKASNLMATPDGLLTILDTDSFQVRDPDSGVVFRCPVSSDEYRPPELKSTDVEISETHDRFVLAILVFQILMEGQHPFAAKYTGARADDQDDPSLQDRIDMGQFPHFHSAGNPWEIPPNLLSMNILHSELRDLFRRCFVDGHAHPERRPRPEDWLKTLRALVEDRSRWRQCSLHARHVHNAGLGQCPWCALAMSEEEHFPSPPPRDLPAMERELPRHPSARPPLESPAPPVESAVLLVDPTPPSPNQEQRISTPPIPTDRRVSTPPNPTDRRISTPPHPPDGAGQWLSTAAIVFLIVLVVLIIMAVAMSSQR